MHSISSALQRWAAASPCKLSGRDELLSGRMKNSAIQPWDQYKQNSLSVVGLCIWICTAKVKELKKVKMFLQQVFFLLYHLKKWILCHYVLTLMYCTSKPAWFFFFFLGTQSNSKRTDVWVELENWICLIHKQIIQNHFMNWFIISKE